MTARTTTVAVMQPYFFPYAGYYRLLSAADVLVVFDCVQFTRRSWISRNLFLTNNSNKDWLNLPIAKSPQQTKIYDLEFQVEKAAKLENFQFSRKLENNLSERLFNYNLKPVDLLIDQIKWVQEMLGIECDVVKSSDLEIPDNLNGQDRVIAAAIKKNATTYVNLSGGINLYSKSHFHSEGINLKILSPYEKSKQNILERILFEENNILRKEILEETKYFPDSDLLQ